MLSVGACVVGILLLQPCIARGVDREFQRTRRIVAAYSHQSTCTNRCSCNAGGTDRVTAVPDADERVWRHFPPRGFQKVSVADSRYDYMDVGVPRKGQGGCFQIPLAVVSCLSGACVDECPNVVG